MILSLPCLPLYAGEPVSVVEFAGGGPYLAVFQDKAETPGNRLERTEGIRRVSYTTEE